MKPRATRGKGAGSALPAMLSIRLRPRSFPYRKDTFQGLYRPKKRLVGDAGRRDESEVAGVPHGRLAEKPQDHQKPGENP